MTNQIFKLFFSENNMAVQENNTSALLIDQLKIDNIKLEQEVNKLKIRELKEIQKCGELKKENINFIGFKTSIFPKNTRNFIPSSFKWLRNIILRLLMCLVKPLIKSSQQ